MSLAFIFFSLFLVFGAVCSNSEQGNLSGISGVASFFCFIAWLFAAGEGVNEMIERERQMKIRYRNN
jgi:hypothetical protein